MSQTAFHPHNAMVTLTEMAIFLLLVVCPYSPPVEVFYGSTCVPIIVPCRAERCVCLPCASHLKSDQISEDRVRLMSDLFTEWPEHNATVATPLLKELQPPRHRR